MVLPGKHDALIEVKRPLQDKTGLNFLKNLTEQDSAENKIN